MLYRTENTFSFSNYPISIFFIKPYIVKEISLYVNNKPIVLNDFVQKIVKNVIDAVINSLKDIDKKIKEIDLRYKKGK